MVLGLVTPVFSIAGAVGLFAASAATSEAPAETAAEADDGEGMFGDFGDFDLGFICWHCLKHASSKLVTLRTLEPMGMKRSHDISMESTHGAATALCCSCGVPMVPNQPRPWNTVSFASALQFVLPILSLLRSMRCAACLKAEASRVDASAFHRIASCAVTA
eukprot:Skav212408  [mRNA]  locus=scaffold469:144248:145396:- [translate_table: standard]